MSNSSPESTADEEVGVIPVKLDVASTRGDYRQEVSREESSSCESVSDRDDQLNEGSGAESSSCQSESSRDDHADDETSNRSSGDDDAESDLSYVEEDQKPPEQPLIGSTTSSFYGTQNRPRRLELPITSRSTGSIQGEGAKPDLGAQRSAVTYVQVSSFSDDESTSIEE